MCFLLFAGFLFVACQNGNTSSGKDEINEELLSQVEFSNPSNGSKIKLGEILPLKWRLLNDSITIDSFQIFSNDQFLATLPADSLEYYWNSGNSGIGKITMMLKAYSSTCNIRTSTMVVNVLSDIIPKRYTYKLVNTFPHSRETYTQGLIYHQGWFYESAGQYGKSALKKVKPETGVIVNMAGLESNIFAEGIALKGNEIYQISWREGICIVYDKELLKQNRRFSYEVAEGWGLEFNGREFLMTDGSNVIYKLDSGTFSVTNRIEVMDNFGKVDNLNELEIVKGKLYANVYMQNIVVIIDPESGKVLGKIDFSGLLPNSDRKTDTDVLNGMAFNKESGHLYITGKNWPKLFEVQLIEIK